MKRNIKNKNTQLENLQTIGLYYTFLRRIAVDSWHFDGLPFQDKDICLRANNILNDCFVSGVPAGLWKTDEFFQVGHITGSSGLTWYGGYTSYQCMTAISTISKDISEIATLIPSIRENTSYDFVSIDGMCRHFAQLLYDCDSAISVNLKAQNTPAILSAPDGQELTIANMYEQIAGHKPVVYTRDMSPLKSQYDDIRMIAYQTPAQFVSGNIEQVKSMLLSDFLFMVGVNNRTQAKSAQMTSPEIMQDSSTLMVIRNSYQRAREHFCDQCNEKFGLNVKAEFTDTIIGNESLIDPFKPYTNILDGGELHANSDH